MGSNANLDAIRLKLQDHPLAVAVYASNWSSYKGGIFSCGIFFQVNHAVTAVGFGDGYWIIRNSWGKKWGEDGNMRLKATQSSQEDCGFRNYVKYPKVLL